ncbi:hypothetical protein GCM10011514_07410 [Emticicia aquatilis]|uniref:YD repeat-containing protein n=1 Tax=Emticicia aquatilis TaxID=1537369 RepID=A0A916YI90_9BACT|nr:hypothetical protein [Emticicia aquatilis]GGD45932.1 hypothetical protein GCM10011514_07410 [Emticicia aquatilis]
MKTFYLKLRNVTLIIVFYLGNYISNAQNPYGNANISVPIYTLKEGNLTVPISLAYDASGVRVDAQASEVGLNWNLIAGGKITRVKRDKADETVRNFADAAPGNRFGGYKTEGFPDVDGLTTDNRFFYFRDLEPDLFTINVSGINAQFYLTNSGIAKNGTNVVLVSQNQDMTIEFTENTAASGVPNIDFPTNLDTWIYGWGSLNAQGKKYYISFKVTLADGTVYYFGETENQREYAFTYNTYKNSNYLSATRQATASYNNDVEKNAREDILAVNAWNLSRIVRPKGALTGTDKYQQITFTYARRAMVLPALAFTEDYSDNTCSPPAATILAYENSPIILKSELQSIESGQFKVEFNSTTVKALEGKVSNIKTIIPDYIDGSLANTNREDISGVNNNPNIPANIEIYTSHNIPAGNYPATDPLTQIPTSEALKHIIVYDKESANTNSIAFYFDYDYFTQNDDGKNTVLFTPEKPKRLRLKGIYQLKIQRTNGDPTSGELQPGYTFIYDPRNLPSKLDLRRDHWGYFNGTINASTNDGVLLTIGYPRNVSNMVENTNSLSCQNKFRDMEAKEEYKTLGTLLRMNLPSGGYIEYSYGLHDCDNYFTEKQIVNAQPVKIGLKKVGGIRVNQVNTYDPVTNATYITRYTYAKKDNPSESSGFLSVWPNYTYCRMNKVAAGTNVTGISFTNPDGTKWVPDREYYSASQYALIQSQYVNGLPVMYRRVKVEDIKIENGNEISNGYTEYEYNNNEQPPYMILQNGQMSFDVDNSSVVGKCFDAYYYLGYRYPKFDLTRGTLKAVRIYKNGLTNPLQETLYNYNVTDYNTNGPLGFIPINAAAIAPPYDVKFRDNRSAGKIIGRVVIGTGLAFAGNAVSQLGTVSSIMNATGNNSAFFSPLKELTPFNILVQILDGLLGTRIEDRSNYSIDKFKVPVGKIVLNNVINKSYDQSGLNPNETTTSYVYGSSNHAQITKTTTTHKPTPSSAVTEEIEQNISYSYDFNTTSATGNDLLGIKRLQERKIIVPIESYTKRNTRVIGGSYIEFNSVESLVGLPSKTFQLELSTSSTSFTPVTVNAGTITKNSNYVLKSTFSEYSDYGLPIRFNATDAPETKIIYGISGQSFLPSEVITAFGTTLSRSTKFEHIPLFGTSKITAPDNSFTTTEFDEIGRVRAVKDLDGNIRKSYNYNYAEKTLANRTFSVTMNVTNNGSLITTKTLSDTETYSSASNGDVLVLSVLPNEGVGSLVMIVDNSLHWSRKILNNWPSISAGVDGIPAFKYPALGAAKQKIGLVTFTITAYSLPDGKGDIIGFRRIKLNID